MTEVDLVLRELTLEDKDAFADAVREFERTDPEFTFAFGFHEDGDFGAYLADLEGQQRGLGLPVGWVPGTFLVGVMGKKVIGRVSLRHELNDYLLEREGHVGYGVVASARRKGYASQMLKLTLPRARALGIKRILVTCDEDNAGSIAVIEGCGGELEDVRVFEDSNVPKRRYWLST
jgi:predicted acetyltransferase